MQRIEALTSGFSQPVLSSNSVYNKAGVDIEETSRSSALLQSYKEVNRPVVHPAPLPLSSEVRRQGSFPQNSPPLAPRDASGRMQMPPVGRSSTPTPACDGKSSPTISPSYRIRVPGVGPNRSFTRPAQIDSQANTHHCQSSPQPLPCNSPQTHTAFRQVRLCGTTSISQTHQSHPGLPRPGVSSPPPPHIPPYVRVR